MARTYFLIAGEASGDLHASHLVRALRQLHPDASFHGVGGDLMAAEGVRLVYHYRQLAYMGWWPVLRHLPTILRGMKRCQQEILHVQPTAVVLVDYPGFNLRMARFLRTHTQIPVYYYIAPKLWAWKEHRIKALRRDVDRVLSILPFEVEYFRQRHQYEVTYVGNPTVDEVAQFQAQHASNNTEGGQRVIALLPGSRRQEIRANLPRMIEAALPYATQYPLVVAGAPGIDDDFYRTWTEGRNVQLVRDKTYELLSESVAALVTSGTATLETALFDVPQVVCYHMRFGWAVRILRRILLRVQHVSLVNLIVGSSLVPELIGGDMTVERVRHHLSRILPSGADRATQLDGYRELRRRLGEPGAAKRAAGAMDGGPTAPPRPSPTGEGDLMSP